MSFERLQEPLDRNVDPLTTLLTLKSNVMKKLIPVFIALFTLLLFVSAVNAQSKIHNPELPKGLVFQWRIVTETVNSSWSNDDFTIRRTTDGLVIFYGEYKDLASAMAGLPELPEDTEVKDVSLIPFFNQKSISASDAFTLMGDRTWFDANNEEMEDAVSFTVYFETFVTPISSHSIEDIDEALSFEILPNRTFAYSAGEFKTLEEAEEYEAELKSMGYESAQVNKFLNGQKVAMHELEEIYAYAYMGFE